MLPPDVREWLAADHLAWFVIEAVGGMDLSAFYAAYRADGHGRAAYEPSVMVALILYAFASNVRSSRAIECHCRQDVAYRVITGNLLPDHATIARFICRHERALAVLFAGVLKLCDRAGLVKPGVVSIDGTRIAGNASPEVDYQFEQIASEILAEARATDEAEDEVFGEARGDELPEQLRTAEGRREFFRQAREQMRREEESPVAGEPEADRTDEVSFELDANEIVGRGRQGRDAWLREGKRQLEQHRWENPDPIPRSRGKRLLLSAERLGSDLDVERRANEAYEHYPGDRARPVGSAAGRPGGAVSAARGAGRQGERDRPGLTADPDRVRVRSGLQRAGRGQRAADRARRGDHQRLDRLLTARSDGHRDPGRVGARGDRSLPEGGRRRRRLLERAAHGRVVANKHIPVLVAPDVPIQGVHGPAGSSDGVGRPLSAAVMAWSR